MSKFDRVLSDEWLPLEFKSGNDVPVTSLMVNLKTLKSIVEQVEQAVLAKLAEQEPVMYARTYYGEIDWDEACVTAENDGTLIHATDMREEDFTKHGYAVIPLYTHPIPCISTAIHKNTCVSENGENDRQLARHQPCGCVICYCENQERCLGCGAKHCGTHDVDEIPNPVYVDHIADASKLVADMYWINPDYPSYTSILDAFDPILSAVDVEIGDQFEVGRAKTLPTLTIEVTELEENGDVKAYKVVGGDHITEPVLD